MTVYVRSPLGTITILDPKTWDISKPLATLKPIEWSWSFSESSAPSIIMTIRLAPPSIALWALLDPAVRPILLIQERVDRKPTPESNTTIVAGQRVQSRVRNEDNSVTLTTVFWEQDLIDYSPPAVDTSNWANQSDVGLIISNVLNKVYGAGKWQQIVQTTSDAQQLTGSFPTYQAATNLAKNPRLGVDSTGWTAVGSGGTLSRGTNANAAYPFQNYARLGLSTNTPLSVGIAYVQAVPFTAGQQYTFSMYGQVSRAGGGNQMSARLIWLDGAGNEVGARAYAATRVTTSNWTQRFTITATAPVGAASFSMTFYAGTGASAWSSADILYATAVLITEGNGLETDGTNTVTYFDGDATNGLNGYNYAWQDTANASPSTRTPILDRDPDSLTWKPGQSAWDFLTPILETVGGRLQAWSGNPPFGYRWITNRFTPVGIVGRYVEGANLYSITQDVDLTAEFNDGTPMFADAVIFRYSWTDSQGVQREAFDAYPTSGYTKPWYQELDAPFPGRGRAQGLYLRMRARASMLTLVVPYNPGLYPSRQVSVTSSQLGGSFLGIIDTVDHDPYAGTTTIRTKNTISYPTNAWVTKTTAWSGLTGTWAAQ